MNLMKRHMLCMSRIAIKTVGYSLLMVGIIFFMGIMSGDNLRTVQNDFGFAFKYASIYILLSFAISVATCYFPVILSFGGERKTFFICRHMFNIIIMFFCILLNAITDLINNKFSLFGMAIKGSFFLFLTGMICVLGIAIWKWGNTGYFIFLFMVGVIGGMFPILYYGAIVKKFMEIRNIAFITITITCLFYAIVSLIDYKIVNNYEIKKEYMRRM